MSGVWQRAYSRNFWSATAPRCCQSWMTSGHMCTRSSGSWSGPVAESLPRGSGFGKEGKDAIVVTRQVLVPEIWIQHDFLVGADLVVGRELSGRGTDRVHQSRGHLHARSDPICQVQMTTGLMDTV